jgi:hypothetical protein
MVGGADGNVAGAVQRQALQLRGVPCQRRRRHYLDDPMPPACSALSQQYTCPFQQLPERCTAFSTVITGHTNSILSGVASVDSVSTTSSLTCISRWHRHRSDGSEHLRQPVLICLPQQPIRLVHNLPAGSARHRFTKCSHWLSAHRQARSKLSGSCVSDNGVHRVTLPAALQRLVEPQAARGCLVADAPAACASETHQELEVG